MATLTLKRTVTCKVHLCDVGEVDPETGEVAFKTVEDQLESAYAWVDVCWPGLVGEEFMEFDEGEWEEVR